MTDLTPSSFLFQSFCKHELAHPINTFVSSLDGEMVRLADCGIENALFLGRRDELEAKG